MTTTKIITREFVLQQGAVQSLSPVSNSAWSSFMNAYAGDPGSNDATISGTILLQKGYYYILGASDDRGTIWINDDYIITMFAYGANISRTSVVDNTRVFHPGGLMRVRYRSINSGGGPRGVAITISEEIATVYSLGSLGSLGQPGYTYSVGNLIWNTRAGLVTNIGRYQVTMPFRATITAHAWGAGAGAGGLDGTEGGRGSPGLYNTANFEVERGDTIEVFIGQGGGPPPPTVARQGSTPGGAGGTSRININGNTTKSFNGGTGGRAGPAGWSGGGGGGGGASGVLVNNIPTIVAGGGGGGGGGGNYSQPYAPRQQGDITKNATGSYSPGSRALDIDPSNATLSAGAQINYYYEFSTLPTPPSASGSTRALVFGYGSIPDGSQTRTATTNSKVNLSSSDVLTFWVNKGTEAGWGQTPDSGEQLRLEYSTNGSTWTEITNVPVNVTPNIWLIRSPQVPAGAKVSGGVFLRFRQTTNGDAASKRDTWAITSVFNGSPTLDFRGELGSSKGVNEGGGDGGGGGGGGGGYPGGQGGATPGGDIPGEAGQCGGNFPDNVGATTGTNSPYYKSGYGGGSNPPNGTGQNGRVVLLIEPLSLVSVKVAGEWKQSPEAFVKVSGAWRDIDTIYVKVDGSWREINGSGQGDIALTGNSQSYGTSTRSYS